MQLAFLPAIKLLLRISNTLVESLSLRFMTKPKNAILLYDVWIKSGDTFCLEKYMLMKLFVAFSLSNFYST